MDLCDNGLKPLQQVVHGSLPGGAAGEYVGVDDHHRPAQPIHTVIVDQPNILVWLIGSRYACLQSKPSHKLVQDGSLAS